MKILSINSAGKAGKLVKTVLRKNESIPHRHGVSSTKETNCKFVKECTDFSACYPEDYRFQYVMNIEHLRSNHRGEGTKAIKKVVKKSLEDTQTQGRVTLAAVNIDISKPHPFGFYYKLGFRALGDTYNKMGAEGVRVSPESIVYMYLPKENIRHCLDYRVKGDTTTYAYKHYINRLR